MKIAERRDEYIKADAEGKAELLRIVYGLQGHQLWKHKQSGKWIVSHAGIESIAAQEGIRVGYQVVRCEPDLIVILATGDGQETFGEASPANTKMPYPVAMAEKRGFDRYVLKRVLGEVGGHGADFYGEDEADSFRDEKPTQEATREETPAERAKAGVPASEKTPVAMSDILQPVIGAADVSEIDLAIEAVSAKRANTKWKDAGLIWLKAIREMTEESDTEKRRVIYGGLKGRLQAEVATSDINETTNDLLLAMAADHGKALRDRDELEGGFKNRMG